MCLHQPRHQDVQEALPQDISRLHHHRGRFLPHLCTSKQRPYGATTSSHRWTGRDHSIGQPLGGAVQSVSPPEIRLSHQCRDLQQHPTIKYMHKYVYKGHDGANARFHRPDGVASDAAGAAPDQPRNEVQDYLDGRYISRRKRRTASWSSQCTRCTLRFSVFNFISTVTKGLFYMMGKSNGLSSEVRLRQHSPRTSPICTTYA